MKVVVEHPITHHFLDATNQWQSNIKNARLFDSAADAVTHSARNLKPPYNVVLKFEDPKYDFRLLANEDPEIGSMKEQSREMIQSSNLLIAESREMVGQSHTVMVASKKSIAGSRRRSAS
jgi:hypothetical protein